MSKVLELCKIAKNASFELAGMKTEEKNAILDKMAKVLLTAEADILAANQLDLTAYKQKPNYSTAFLDRLTLNSARIAQMAEGITEVISLTDPVGEVIDNYTAEKSGLKIQKVRSPLGVIGVIYEARPNVTADVAALTLKSGNACVLRGGSDAINSNRAIYNALKKAIGKYEFLQFIDSADRADTLALLKCGGAVDVVIPRGGDALKHYCLEHATMPVIASAGGNCHIYVDEDANLAWAEDIIINAKTQRPGVCNALEHLIVHSAHKDAFLKVITNKLEKLGVEVIQNPTDEVAKTEFESLKITTQVVDNLQEAIAIINQNSTNHSDGIVSNNKENIKKFTTLVDSAAVYVNASTRFTDGFEFGLGAEIGISTQKLHVRGPIGLRELTSSRYICEGNGLVRK